MSDFFNRFRYPKKYIKPAAAEECRSVQKDQSVVWDVASVNGAASDVFEQVGAAAKSFVSFSKSSRGVLEILRYAEFQDFRLKSGASFGYAFSPKVELMLDGVEIKNERFVSATYKGYPVLASDFKSGAGVIRSFYVSSKVPAVIEKIEVTNKTAAKVTFTAVEKQNRFTYKTRAVKKVRFLVADGRLEVGSRIVDGNGDFRSGIEASVKKLLVPGATGICYIVHYAIRKGETLNFNAEKEIRDRIKTLSQPKN